jgi:hypothetical protein
MDLRHRGKSIKAEKRLGERGAKAGTVADRGIDDARRLQIANSAPSIGG